MTTPKKVLVVDDDQLMRMMLGMMLTRAGYEVMSAEDGRSALEKVATEKPDLVLTDGLMPDMHGLTVCKAIKRLAAPPKVVLLTASTSEMKRAEAYAPDDILIKPVRSAELIACIERLLSDALQFTECGS
ncbi:MAG TPA: response regulator [Blastocatellia bacterium]|jgi:DNA-binding response OmpR family regulator